jgi:hypothetical protein
MSYEVPRAAKLLVDVQSKFIGKDEGKMHKAGKKVKVQRSPSNPGEFIIWFGAGNKEYAKVQSLDLRQTIEYTDGRPEGHQ